jgi:uncharacterized linocin/CFP29 family protein
MAADKMDIATDVAISFVHSQYDKHTFPVAECRIEAILLASM